MPTALSVPLSYLGYAGALMLGAAAWLVALADTMIYARVEDGRLDRAWLDLVQALTRHSDKVMWAALACAAVAFALALLAMLPGDGAPGGAEAAVAKAHRAYLLRHGAVALAFVVLTVLATGRMGGFDADIAAVAAFAWSLWILAAGWRAFAAGAAVTGPALWGLALGADLLLLGVFVFFWIMIEIQGFRMF